MRRRPLPAAGGSEVPRRGADLQAPAVAHLHVPRARGELPRRRSRGRVRRAALSRPARPRAPHRARHGAPHNALVHQPLQPLRTIPRHPTNQRTQRRGQTGGARAPADHVPLPAPAARHHRGGAGGQGRRAERTRARQHNARTRLPHPRVHHRLHRQILRHTQRRRNWRGKRRGPPQTRGQATQQHEESPTRVRRTDVHPHRKQGPINKVRQRPTRHHHQNSLNKRRGHHDRVRTGRLRRLQRQRIQDSVVADPNGPRGAHEAPPVSTASSGGSDGTWRPGGGRGLGAGSSSVGSRKPVARAFPQPPLSRPSSGASRPGRNDRGTRTRAAECRVLRLGVRAWPACPRALATALS